MESEVVSEKEGYELPEEVFAPFRELAKQIHELHKMAETLGIFLDHRELLECPNCHLVEDVTIAGVLQVYKGSDELSDEDTGLRFIPLDNEDKKFQCPQCETKITLPDVEFEDECGD